MNLRVPLSWLKEYVEIMKTPEELAQTLTMAGLEVEAIDSIGQAWEDKIITAQIEHLEKVEGSDHLNATKINTGSEVLDVVCGAPNIKEGDKVPLALVGAKVGENTILATKKFGHLSNGMLCSPKELGMGSDHSGIYILEPGTPLGLPLVDLLGETVLEFSIKAHRGDLSSIIGIAREVAALTNKPLKLPPFQFSQQGTPTPEMITVTVEDATLCPRYTAHAISNVKIGPSPNWMSRRLLAAGMRPINNVVDILNYVMLETGQPLHGFDYDLIRRREIIVRRAHEGERITTLDEVDRKLSPEMLLITDPKGPTAIAGVMGGAISEVNDGTTTVLLESATFKGSNIRRTSVNLGLRSDASSRYEKGLDPNLVIQGAHRALQLLEELVGTKAHPGIVDVYPAPTQQRTITFDPSQVEWLTGVKASSQRASEALKALNFKVVPDDHKLRVTVPTYRQDVEEGADLVEEVVRMIGYDQIPSTIPAGPLPEPSLDRWFEREYEVRDSMIGAGLTEIVTYAMTSRARMTKLLAYPNEQAFQALLSTTGAVTTMEERSDPNLDPKSLPAVSLTNPLTTDMESMRLSLMNSLLEITQENAKHNHDGLRFFEIGRRYLPAEPHPREVRSLGIALYGPGAISWLSELSRPADFYDLKGLVENLLEHLHIMDYRFVPAQHPTFHPGRCARLEIKLDGQHIPVGVLGEVHPLVQQRYDFANRAYLAEIDLEILYRAVPQHRTYHPIYRQQELTRDLAVVVDGQIPAGQIAEAIRQSGGDLLRSVQLFDVYTGDPIPEGQKNLTYSLVYQASERTLTDAEAGKIQERILQSLRQRFNAVLR